MRRFHRSKTTASRAIALGLDLGRDTLALVALQGGTPPSLAGFHRVARNAAEPAALLADAWHALGAPQAAVAQALPAGACECRQLALPPMTRRRLDAVMAVEARALLPAPPVDVAFDYRRLATDGGAAEPDQWLLCAAPLSLVHAARAPLLAAGLRPGAVGLDVLALWAVCARHPLWRQHRFGRRLILHADGPTVTLHPWQAGARLPDRPLLAADAAARERLLASCDAEAVFCVGDTADTVAGHYRALNPHRTLCTDPLQQPQLPGAALALAWGVALGALPC